MWESTAASSPQPLAIGDLDAAVERFYDIVPRRAERGAEVKGAAVLNLAAAAALSGGLTVELAQLSEPVVMVPAARPVSAVYHVWRVPSPDGVLSALSAVRAHPQAQRWHDAFAESIADEALQLVHPSSHSRVP